LEAAGDQPGQSADVIDMHVGEDKGLYAVDGKVDFQVAGCRAVPGYFTALKQAAVDQYAECWGQMQLVTGARDSVRGTVMFDIRIARWHALHPPVLAVWILGRQGRRYLEPVHSLAFYGAGVRQAERMPLPCSVCVND